MRSDAVFWITGDIPMEIGTCLDRNSRYWKLGYECVFVGCNTRAALTGFTWPRLCGGGRC